MPFKLPILYGIVLIILILATSSISLKPYKTNKSEKKEDSTHNTTKNNNETETDDSATYNPKTYSQFLKYLPLIILIVILLVLCWAYTYLWKKWQTRNSQPPLVSDIELRETLQKTPRNVSKAISISKVLGKRKDNRRDKRKDESTDESKSVSTDQETLSSFEVPNHCDEFWREYVGEDWENTYFWDERGSRYENITDLGMNIRRAKHVQQIPKSKSEPESIYSRNLPSPSRSAKAKSIPDIQDGIQNTSRRNVGTSTRSYGSSSNESTGFNIEVIKIKANVYGAGEEDD